MFDNMTHDDMAAAIELIAGRAKTECSGNAVSYTHLDVYKRQLLAVLKHNQRGDAHDAILHGQVLVVVDVAFGLSLIHI